MGGILKLRRAGVAWATGVLLLAVFVAVAAHHAEGRRLAELLRSAQPAWLGAAAALQVATYVCAAAVWQRALRRNGGVRRSVRSLVPLGLAKLFADQALPSAGVSGTLLVVHGLLRRGVPRGLAIAAMLADLVSWYAAYALVGAAALAILWHRGELTGVLVAIGVAFLLLATGVPLAILGLRGRERSLPRWVQHLPWANEVFAAIADAQPGAIFGGTLALETATLQLAIFALDATTLGLMLRAIATPAAAAVVFASFVIASMVATLAWVPGGLGTFEGTCVAMLHVHGVTIEAALAATLLARGFTFWLPMAPGLAIARREMMRATASAAPTAGAETP
jgi:uncharacterized membrane protein YbhN (UPF0104 family)